MAGHVMNCFEIQNTDELRMNYRLVRVDGPFDPDLGDGDVAERNLQQLVKRMQYEEKIPVAIQRAGAQPILAVPMEHRLNRTEYDLAPDVAVLQPLETSGSIALSSTDRESERIGMAFLGWHLRSPLFRDNRLWSSGTSMYFSKRPLNYMQDDREIDVFRGFGFRLDWVDDRLRLWVKLAHRYAESSWLLDAYSVSDIQQRLRMRHMLYHYGHRWFPVQLLGITGRSIEEQRFVPDGSRQPISVYEYTLQDTSSGRPPAWIESLDAKSPAIAYRYPGNEKKRNGAAALCKLLVPTEDERTRGVHRWSIIDPAKRFEETRQMVETFLQNASLGGVPIRIVSQPLRTARRVFPVPVQEFGQEKKIIVGRNSTSGEVSLSELGRKRWECLLDTEGGFAVNRPLDAQYVVVPETLERQIGDDFKDRLEKTVRSLIKRSYNWSRVIYADRDKRTLKQQVDSITEAIQEAKFGSGRGLLVLPAQANPDLHNLLKRKLRDRFHFQCVNARKLRDFYELRPHDGRAVYTVKDTLAGRYVSYLRYTAMGLLLVNRKWPWVLTEGTHYDTYVAIDVLHHTAAFTFVSDGGRQCHMQIVESQQSEKLLRKQVQTVVYDYFNHQLQDTGKSPRAIILRRDGGAFRSEWLGFQQAIEQLVREGKLAKEVQLGVIEVHKTTAEGMRLVEEIHGGVLRNPTVGAWKALTRQEGLVCTTGFPFRFSGTVNPLFIRIVAGDLDIEKILEDTFDLSQLCWPVPDRCMRLSIDLKLCDDNLRATAAAADDDEGQFGEEELDDEGEERSAIDWHG